LSVGIFAISVDLESHGYLFSSSINGYNASQCAMHCMPSVRFARLLMRLHSLCMFISQSESTISRKRQLRQNASDKFYL